VFELAVEDEFSAAHNLRGYEGDCEKLHGHNWRVRAQLRAERLDPLGMVMDFRWLKAALREILSPLDHSYINEVAPFENLNPTTENLCRYVAERLQERLPAGVRLARVTCWESQECSASYVPPRGQGGAP